MAVDYEIELRRPLSTKPIEESWEIIRDVVGDALGWGSLSGVNRQDGELLTVMQLQRFGGVSLSARFLNHRNPGKLYSADDPRWDDTITLEVGSDASSFTEIIEVLLPALIAGFQPYVAIGAPVDLLIDCYDLDCLHSAAFPRIFAVSFLSESYARRSFGADVQDLRQVLVSKVAELKSCYKGLYVIGSNQRQSYEEACMTARDLTQACGGQAPFPC